MRHGIVRISKLAQEKAQQKTLILVLHGIIAKERGQIVGDRRIKGAAHKIGGV